MERIRVTLETVTATFLHVEPTGEARWRAAPFRGVARWWFRALVGASVPAEEVRRREAEVFGTAEEPSPVLLRLFPDTAAHPGASPKFNVNPGSQKSALRYAIRAEEKATLELVAASGAGGGQSPVRQACAAMWVALHFGGVGQRSRRGAGSLRITHVQGVDELKPVPVSSPADYARELGQGLRAVRAIMGVSGFRPLAHEAEFPVMHPKCAAGWIVGLSLPKGNASIADREARVRLAIMNARRSLSSHKAGKPEQEFGSVKPRLSSPTWVRVANIAIDSALLVVTLLRHSGAGTSANWDNVEAFVRVLDPKAAVVNLGG